MPRRPEGLSAARVRTAPEGRYCDGDLLYLAVHGSERAYWILRYRRNGKLREMGLGRARGRNAVTLVEARGKAAELHRLIRAGIDPLAQRDANRAAALAEAQIAKAAAVTFEAAATEYIVAHAPGWRSPKHAAQWRATLAAYALPVFGATAVADVAVEHVLDALRPIWTTKPETAGRVRGRVEAVLDYAKARGWRSGENPAAWKGGLDHLLPARGKIRRVEHHAALPWREAGTFMEALRRQAGIGARALEFSILTAARSGEVRGATWAEVDLDRAVWVVPASRMKGGRDHRVPLAFAALGLLRNMARLRSGAGVLVFPGAAEGRPLSDMSMTAVLRRMGRGDLTAHGFRSTFRDWAAETTAYPREVAEQALAHTIGDKVEAAYRRGDLFEKRQQLMLAWADFCSSPAPAAGAVVPIRASA